MKDTRIVVTVTVALIALIGVGCGGNNTSREEPGSTVAGPQTGGAKQASLTEADLDKFERGLGKEIEAVKAAQAKAASATNAQERGEAMQAQWDTATIPQGAEASGLGEPRYREVRDAVNRVFTMLDFQGKIDGPLSIDLERADAATKERVSRDAFADMPPESAAALRARMDRLVPLWSEYKKLVAVAG
jgi:hypothetical protein